jgi:transposase
LANPISEEKRKDIIFHKKKGLGNKSIADSLDISERTVLRIWKLFSETESITPKPRRCGMRPAISSEEICKVEEKIKEKPDVTLRELIEVFDLKISESGLSKKLKKIGYTFKRDTCRTKQGYVSVFKERKSQQ